RNNYIPGCPYLINVYSLLLKICLKFLRREASTIKLLHGIKIYRQVDFFPGYLCNHLVNIVIPLGEPAEIIPHLLGVGMKNMRTIFLDHYAVFIKIIICVAADMVSPLNDKHLFV